VTGGVCGVSAHELMPLVSGAAVFVAIGAGMGLVNDHQFRAGPHEVIALLVRLDKIH
jgi:hypothetical protein